MAKEDYRDARKEERNASDEEEAKSLLSSGSSEHEDPVVHPGPPVRQSSIARIHENGGLRTPRTLNRVRFDLDLPQPNGTSNGHTEEWIEEEDFLTDHERGRRSSTGQRAPLLTDIEAPSVTVASADLGFNADDLLESARPKSGMRSAFMNMANSIIGAGIIGD
ncbi:MAG: hypothetical protein M1835_002047 [Candelina submexicana]|nr:MAG: hypothetical protein M1835_002047 [Candelina submexicana]